MPNNLTFEQAEERYLETLKQYVPVVARVHGGNHPEFHGIRSVFDVIVEKTREAGAQEPRLHQQFAKLREISNDYEVPDDVCESYEAVYRMLREIDEAYHA